MSKVTFEDKVSLKEDPSLARKNKITDNDITELKNSINALYDGFNIVTPLTHTQTITAAEIVVGANVPLTIDLPGAGKYLRQISGRMEMIFNSIAHDATNLEVKFSNGFGPSWVTLNNIEATEDAIATSPEVALSGIDVADIENLGLAAIIGGSPTVGDSDVKLKIIYSIEDVLQL